MRTLPFRPATWAVLSTYVAAYVLLDWVSYIHPIAPYAITPWNPPPGLSLALLLGLGLRYAPTLFVASILAEVAVRGLGATAVQIVVYCLVLSAGYTAIAAYLLRVVRIEPRFRTLRDLAWFTGAVAVGTAVIATCYVGLHLAGGEFSWREYPAYLLQFWVGDVIGVVVTTPLLLTLIRVPRSAFRATPEKALQAAALFATLAVIFTLGHASAYKFFYLLFLPLIWVSVRSGFEGATVAVFATQVGLIVAVQLAGYEAGSVLELQMLMLALAVTALFLGMAVSQWQRTREDLERREAELDTVVSTAPDGILTIDDTQRIVALNEAATRMFGARDAELLGSPLSRLIHGLPAELAHLRVVDARAERAGGGVFPVEVSIGAAPFAGRTLYIAVVRDMSQRKEMEERLRERERDLNRAMRMAAAAEMASALAHELNQPLTAASSYVQACDLMLQRGGTAQERLLDAMNKAVVEVKRAAEVVRRLRDFYRGGTLRLAAVPVDELVASAAAAVRNRLERHRIVLATTLAPGLPPVQADRVQIEMVLHNLLAIAIVSIAAAECGTRRITVDAAPGAGGFVDIAVHDSGPGVDDALRDQLFTAFATSKVHGLGMGLAISRSIVEQHGGRLWLDAHAPGARFVLSLPTTRQQEDA